MYAVIGRFSFTTTPDAALRARIAEEITGPLGSLPGFRSLYLISHSDTETSVIHFWDTQADAEQGLQLIIPRTRQLAAEGLVGAVDRSLGEVILHR